MQAIITSQVQWWEVQFKECKQKLFHGYGEKCENKI